MRTISFKRHRFPPEIIRHSIWLYARFTLSFRDVEELLAERGLDVSYETVRRWFLKFGSTMALSRYQSVVVQIWRGSYAHAAAVTVCHTLIASLRNRRNVFRVIR